MTARCGTRPRAALPDAARPFRGCFQFEGPGLALRAVQRRQRADHRTLRRAPGWRPSLQPRHDVLLEPAMEQGEKATIADPFLYPFHQWLVRDRVEVALQVGIDHEGEAFLEQTIYFAQRVTAAAPRPKAVALRTERGLEDRFDDEFHRHLRDPVLDRRDAQRPGPAIVLGDFHSPDRLRAVGSLPQLGRQLAQILLRVCLEPLDAHTIHAGRAPIGPDTCPGRREGRRRVHLIDQTVPTSSFDAVDQRRHHALRPHRGFHPRPHWEAFCLQGFCTTFSRIGTGDALLPLRAHHASTFLPTFPRSGFANRTSRDRSRSGTMRALTPGDLAHDRQVSPLTPLCRPDIPSPTTPCPPVVAFTVTSARPVRPSGPGFAMLSRARQDTPPNRVRSPTGCPFAAGCSPPRLATTQLPLATCAVTSHDKDLHLADKASSRFPPPTPPGIRSTYHGGFLKFVTQGDGRPGGSGPGRGTRRWSWPLWLGSFGLCASSPCR